MTELSCAGWRATFNLQRMCEHSKRELPAITGEGTGRKHERNALARPNGALNRRMQAAVQACRFGFCRNRPVTTTWLATGMLPMMAQVDT
jgi:hypothetical protein